MGKHAGTISVSIKEESPGLPWMTETGSYEREEDVKTKPDQNEEKELLFFPDCDKLEINYPRSCG